jgi:hypothetical protein
MTGDPVRRVAVLAVLAAAGAVAQVGAARPPTEGPSLQRYLSQKSWPVRASVLRASSVDEAIDGWLVHGDPPYLGGIAARCRSLRAVEPRGRLLRVAPPTGSARSTRASHVHIRTCAAGARG